MVNIQPAPRPVQLRPQARGRVWLLRLASLPFLAAGAFLVLQLFEHPLILMFGADTAARVEEVRPYWRGADERRFDLTYSYDTGRGGRETAYGRIDTGGTPPPAVGQTLPVRALVVGPFDGAALRDGDTGARGFVCGGIFVLVWCGFAGLVTAAVWLGPMFDKRLIRDGDVAVGVVTAKRESKRGRTLRRELFYRFQAADGNERSGAAQVSAPIFDRLHEGQSVLVMYRSTDPERSALYDASDFEVAAAAPVQ